MGRFKIQMTLLAFVLFANYPANAETDKLGIFMGVLNDCYDSEATLYAGKICTVPSELLNTVFAACRKYEDYVIEAAVKDPRFRTLSREDHRNMAREAKSAEIEKIIIDTRINMGVCLN